MWLLSGKCTSQARLDGKTAIVTGANTGIGKFTAHDFVKRGARVIIACRDMEKAKKAAEEIRREAKEMENAGEIVVMELDLASLESVRTCAQEILRTEHKIQILVNNAGVAFHPKAKTADGFEIHIGTNHLGHFLLTCLLLPTIIRSAPARIVTVSSYMNYRANCINFDDLNWTKREYSSFYSYCESKLANVMFSAELARRLSDTGVTTYALHPGVVHSDVFRYTSRSYFPGFKWIIFMLTKLFGKTLEQGAQTTIHCAVSEQAGEQTGLYYRDCILSTTNPLAYDPQACKRLWDISAKLVGLGDWDPISDNSV